MFNKFISWKKNIKAYHEIALIAHFDIRGDKALLFEQFRNIIDYIPDPILAERVKKFRVIKNWNPIQDDYEFFCDKNIVTTDRRFSFFKTSFERGKVFRYNLHLVLDTTNKTLIDNIIRIKGLSILYLYNPYFRSWEMKKSPKKLYL